MPTTKVELSMQGLQSRTGYAGIQRRAEYASIIIEKSRVYMGSTVEQSTVCNSNRAEQKSLK
jgi:hypothetical protein